jgi:hypothetical protein
MQLRLSFCLTTYPAAVRSVTMPCALRSAMFRAAGMSGSPPAQVLGDPSQNPDESSTVISRKILLVSGFRCRLEGTPGDSGRPRPGTRVSTTVAKVP